jgi:hypothetical protein
MILPFPALLLATPLLVAAADRVPTFDIGPTCQGATAGAGAGGRGPEICFRTELTARDQLAEQWNSFSAGERDRCVSLTTMTRMPSYVQVLVCLEMTRDARSLRAPSQRTTTGSGVEPPKP